MKRPLYIAAVIVEVAVVLAAYFWIGHFLKSHPHLPDRSHPSGVIVSSEPSVLSASRSKHREVPLNPLPLPDVDALAMRLPYDQDGYRRVRDELLADFAKLHPGVHPFDADMHETLKLMTYLFIWDDYYGENLWPIAASHVASFDDRLPDPLWETFRDLYHYRGGYYEPNPNLAQAFNDRTSNLGAEALPAAMRLWAYQAAVASMCRAKENANPDLDSCLKALPGFATQMVSCYREIVRQHPSQGYLYRCGTLQLYAARSDGPLLEQVSKGIDGVFAAEDPGNQQARVLDGIFNVDYAWVARGHGWANAVSQDGWRLFGERLERANAIFDEVYAHSPQEPGTARFMMDVALGRELPRDQMELWLRRAQNVDGDLFTVYMAKRTYLLPRWNGSDDEEWAFGEECATSSNWAAKIPIMQAECICDRADRDPGVFADPDIWPPLEKVFRAYLAHYPNSTHYRSLFALDAAEGSHWGVAKEQLAILGDAWDPEVFRGGLYPDTLQAVKAH